MTAECKLKEAVSAQKELKKQVEVFQSNIQVGEDNLRTLHEEMEGLRQEKANLEVSEGGRMVGMSYSTSFLHRWKKSTKFCKISEFVVYFLSTHTHRSYTNIHAQMRTHTPHKTKTHTQMHAFVLASFCHDACTMSS